VILRKLCAEGLGSLLLSATVIGSGIMAVRLSGGNDAIALLGNTAATAGILYALIVTLAPVSGAHFNPAVTLVMALRREVSLGAAALYIPAQILGCVLGAWLAHAMFEMPVIQTSGHVRAGAAQMLSEGAATFALVLVILGSARHGLTVVATAVALTILAGYWWTASTSFANPAITIARAMTDTFAGIRPGDVPGFVAGQVSGAIAALLVSSFLWPKGENA
jgi:glycerol uptake facilitator-like aquaporin